MSVPAYKRELSQIEYITMARDLLKYTISVCTKIPKKYSFYGVVHAYELSQKILDNLIQANSYNISNYYKERTFLFDEALGLLKCLDNHILLLQQYIKLEDKKWIKFGNLINYCTSLVKGIKASDKKRMGV